jgi:hypothetical protein
LALTIGASLKDTVAKRTVLPVTIALADDEAAVATADTTFETIINFDDKTGTASIDDVESAKTAWTLAPQMARFPVWNREGDAANHVWHGDDLGTSTDESLVSPTLEISKTNPFILSFSHRFSFETGPAVPNGPDVNFDGGVLELSDADGMTWKHLRIRRRRLPDQALHQPTPEVRRRRG